MLVLFPGQIRAKYKCSSTQGQAIVLISFLVLHSQTSLSLLVTRDITYVAPSTPVQ